MFGNYFKIAWRHVIKYKLHAGINITGLALGLASFIVVSLFLKNEFSYDQFNTKKERIYRLNHGEWSILGTVYADLVRKNFTEVENVVRFDLWSAGSAVLKQGANVHKIEHFVFSDAEVFDVFTLPFVQGSKDQALIDPFSIVLTQSTAKRIFGNSNPVGQMIKYNDYLDYKVTGIIEDVHHSHIPVNAIASFQSLKTICNDPQFMERFDAWNYPTFLLVQPETNISTLENNINQYFSQYSSYFWNEKEGPQFYLKPLSSIYFHDNSKFGYGIHGNMQRIYLGVLLAGFILLIACFNFINLTTARATLRFREIGIRKVLGASRFRLITQILIESVMTCTLASMMAFGITAWSLPRLNTLFETSLSLSNFHSVEFIVILFSGTIFLGVIAGLVPAVQLTTFHPASILKSSKNRDRRSILFRRALIGFQFILSTVLIIGTLLMTKQLQYLKNKNLGFEKEHVLILPVNQNIRNHWEAFKNRLISESGIENVTFSHFALGEVGWIQNWDIETGKLQSNLLHVDPEFVPLMDIDLVGGRNFSWDMNTDKWSKYIVNEEMAKRLSPGPVIGRKLGNGEIIGIVRDFHFNSLRKSISPLVIAWESENMKFANIKIVPQQINRSIRSIQTIWQEFSPEFPFEFSFLDKRIENIYQSEQRLSIIFNTFSVMAIVIASIGLFGLSAFIMARRTREIALRKVLGASVMQIMLNLSKEYTFIVLASNLIAWPIIYIASKKMLQSFAYHTTIDVWIFLLAGVITLAIALFTVSSQTIRAATANPVKALKYE